MTKTKLKLKTFLNELLMSFKHVSLLLKIVSIRFLLTHTVLLLPHQKQSQNQFTKMSFFLSLFLQALGRRVHSHPDRPECVLHGRAPPPRGRGGRHDARPEAGPPGGAVQLCPGP